MAIVTDAFGGHGGIAQYNCDLLRALTDIPEVSEVVAVPRTLPFPPGDLPAKIRYHPSGARGKLRFVCEALLAASGRFDLIVCGHINLLPMAEILRWKLGAPIVLVVYGIDVWEPHRSMLVRRLAARATAVWTISEITRDKMRAWCPIAHNRFVVLPNAIDLERYGPGPRNPDLIARYGLEGRKIIMTLCRLPGRDRYKGVDEVLEILPSLLEREPTLCYLIAGDGEDRARLVQKAAELGVSNHVVFTGFVEEREKIDHYRLADVFVMPGRLEGFGFVFLEALACGVPAIGSRLDGGREALRGGLLGRLVHPDNPTEIEASVIAALGEGRHVPDGLVHFSVEEFRRRARDAVRRVRADSLVTEQRRADGDAGP